MRPYDTVVKHSIPQLTLCRRVTSKDDLVTTLYTPCTTPSATIATDLSVYTCIRLHMLMVRLSEVEILNILKHPRD